MEKEKKRMYTGRHIIMMFFKAIVNPEKRIVKAKIPLIIPEAALILGIIEEKSEALASLTELNNKTKKKNWKKRDLGSPTRK